MAQHLDLEEQEQLDQLKHFWNAWGTAITTVVLLLAGSVAAWNGYQYWQNRQAAQAAALWDALDVAALAGNRARMEQVFGDLKARYPGTEQAAQAGLALAKALQAAGKADGAKDALGWVAQQSTDEGLAALAKLRLSSLLMDQKNHDAALQQLSGKFPHGFDAIVADRRGDILFLQEQRAQAIAEYRKAYQAFDDSVDYRRLVEIKLDALGAAPQAVAALTSAAPAKQP